MNWPKPYAIGWPCTEQINILARMLCRGLLGNRVLLNWCKQHCFNLRMRQAIAMYRIQKELALTDESHFAIEKTTSAFLV
jgi:hypothetical protein